MRVLLIDDDELGLAPRKALLELHGHEVDAADTGVKGVAMFRVKPYDVVVFDLCLDDTPGEDVLRTLRTISKWHPRGDSKWDVRSSGQRPG